MSTRDCPYCGKSGNLYITVYSRKYNRCIACDLIYRQNLESYGDVVATYREGYFERYSDEQLAGQRLRLYDHILTLITENRGAGRLLDVGTGCGFFLVAAQKRQWEVKGVEPSLQSVQMARRQYSLDVFAGTLQEYVDKRQFDAITFINVLEHSVWPWQEIDRAKELLRPGGLIYLRFPNGLLHSQMNRLAHKYLLANRMHKFLVFHKYSFTSNYIRKLLSDRGFVQTTIVNSPPSEGDPNELFRHPGFATYLKRLIYLIAKCTETISCRRLLLGTSLEVTALKPN
jgi:2-polyprenyl-3-methyl-5-hydroxy-6-metoxy-1,4-benzoquinol methylase